MERKYYRVYLYMYSTYNLSFSLCSSFKCIITVSIQTFLVIRYKITFCAFVCIAAQLLSFQTVDACKRFFAVACIGHACQERSDPGAGEEVSLTQYQQQWRNRFGHSTVQYIKGDRRRGNARLIYLCTH